jgi:hypothetical protein
MQNITFLLTFAYGWGVASLDQYLDEQLAHGRAHLSREEALDALGLGVFQSSEVKLLPGAECERGFSIGRSVGRANSPRFS